MKTTTKKKKKNPENVARGRKAQNNGKTFERLVAKDVGGTRVGGRGDCELRKSFDVYTEDYIYECKRYATRPSPKMVMKWLLGVRKRARWEEKGRTGVLCLRFGKGSTLYWFIERVQDSRVKGGKALLWYSNQFPNPHMKKYQL